MIFVPKIRAYGMRYPAFCRSRDLNRLDSGARNRIFIRKYETEKERTIISLV